MRAAPHRPRKRFSQNFLIDEGAIAAIVAAIGPRAGDCMVEIGPGLGAITRPRAHVVRPLHVVEIDRDIVARLTRDFAPGELVMHEGDALAFDFATLGPALRVVGNLPYHISTPLLFHLADCVHVLYDIHVMLQDEVVERIVAAPGSSAYSRLSVMLQYRFEMHSLLHVPPGAFTPPPKVDSSVVRMVPLGPGRPVARDEQLFERLVAAAFSQRRKTLRNAASAVAGPEAFERAGIDARRRGETLSVQEFIALSDAIG